MTLHYDPHHGIFVSDTGRTVALMNRWAHEGDPTLGPKMAAAKEMFEALEQLLKFDSRAYAKGSDLAKDLLFARKVGWDAIAKAKATGA